MKYFAKTWQHTTGLRYPTGLLLTALTVECFQPVLGRDDEAFFKTLRAIGNRSHLLPVYADGVQISRNKDAARLNRLKEKAAALADELADLADNPSDHDDASARKLWKKVFRHSYFDPKEEAAKASSTAVAKGAFGLAPAVFTERAASAVDSTSTASKPWGDLG